MNNTFAEEQARRIKFRKKLKISMVGVAAALLAQAAVYPYAQLAFNYTDSVNGYLFVIVKDKTYPKPGDLIAFFPPENQFYSHGRFIKYVKGVQGDIVDKKGLNFYINNQFIGAAKGFSLTGIPLESSEAGVIPPGKLFVWTPHHDSFDSRYKEIGWIDQNRLIGRAYRII